jgi:putative endonuclease
MEGDNWYYVYILYSSKDGNLYIGLSQNLKKRIYNHNIGLNKSTRYRRPLKLIYVEAFFNKEDAKNREKFFKTGRGREVLKDIIRFSLKDMKECSIGRPAVEAGF